MNYPYEVRSSEFEGKRVLVTGGTAGVGLATVKRFALAGANVLTTARDTTDQLPKGVIFVKSDLATAEGTNTHRKRGALTIRRHRHHRACCRRLKFSCGWVQQII